jgi:anti-sigma regulatory factor (Ser/Thr protein kinase)
MFANIAQRTRALVARQLQFIDEFERNEQDERMLSKLYRLDHLTTRLRRSADCLLVVSGIREEERLSGPAPLLDVLRSAVAEIEGYQAVRIGAVCDVTVRPQLVPDLRLLMAEVLENATAFSPPGTPVEVGARLSDADCQITIVDHGIGLSAERLAEENQRLLERERIEIAPTSFLGLFVVGRLTRRHGLQVNLRQSSGQGVTVDVRVPPSLFSIERTRLRPLPPAPEPRAIEPTTVGLGRQDTDELVRLIRGDGRFEWFEHPPEGTHTAPVQPATTGQHTARAQHAAPVQHERRPGPPGTTRHGLTRREPGWHLPSFGLEQTSRADWPTVARDPDTEQSEMEDFARGIQRVGNGNGNGNGTEPRPEQPAPADPPPADQVRPSPADAPPPAPVRPRPVSAPSRGGLTRRVPGAQLDHALRADDGPAAHPPARNPEAERAALESFLAGLARAEETPTT